MSISSINNVSTYLATSKTSPPQTQITSSASISVLNGNSTRVTLSEAARSVIADDSGTTQHRTPAQTQYIRSAMSDSASAEKLASDMASGGSNIMYNIQGSKPGDPRKLSSGRIIDSDFENKFYSQAAKIDAQRKDIYDSETAKGTNPVAIIAKMIDFTNSQSRDYLEASGLLYSASA